jgi:hypothetical protein
MRDVAEALQDLQDRAVQRDIKRDNMPLLNGRWRLADFGIARYAEASTATRPATAHSPRPSPHPSSGPFNAPAGTRRRSNDKRAFASRNDQVDAFPD